MEKKSTFSRNMSEHVFDKVEIMEYLLFIDFILRLKNIVKVIWEQ